MKKKIPYGISNFQRMIKNNLQDITDTLPS